jgi:hypothetical protein
VDVPEKFVVTFKPGKEMEARVQDLEEAAIASARGKPVTAELDNLSDLVPKSQASDHNDRPPPE